MKVCPIQLKRIAVARHKYIGIRRTSTALLAKAEIARLAT